MALANVALTNTFDEWRTRTNQLVVQSNVYEVNIPDLYYRSNITPSYAYANNIGTTANTFALNTIIGANTAVGAGANAWANVIWSRSNTFAQTASQSTNTFLLAVVSGANNSVGIGANTYAVILGASIGAGANSFSADASNLTTGTVPAARITGTGTISSGTWQGTRIGLTYGGTNAALTASAGAVVYSTSTAFALSAVGTSGQVLTSAGTGAPTWTAQSSLSVGTATNATQLGGVAAASYLLSSTAASTYLALSGGTMTGTIYNATSSSLIIGQAGGLTRGYLYNDTSGFGFLTSGGGWAVRVNYGSSNIYMPGNLYVDGDITAFASSDRNLKDNIVPINNALDKIKQITGVMFDWKNEEISRRGDDLRHDTGVIAQDVEAVLPEVVTTRKDGYKAVRYEKLAGLIIQSIKELSDKVENLQNEIESLKK